MTRRQTKTGCSVFAKVPLLTVKIVTSLQAKESNEGTQCQQAILILSDGSASYEEEIFKTYNADKKVSFCAMILKSYIFLHVFPFHVSD